MVDKAKRAIEDTKALPGRQETKGPIMNIWDIHLGWFVIVALAALFGALIGMELACWRAKKNTYITRGGK